MKIRRDGRFRHPAESHAWEFLKDKGHTLLCHNYHARFAELDLVTLSTEGRIHVCEVKAWKGTSLAHPLEAFSEQRQRDLRHAFGLFLQDSAQSDKLQELELDKREVSFDLIWLRKDATEWHRGIF